MMMLLQLLLLLFLLHFTPRGAINTNKPGDDQYGTTPILWAKEKMLENDVTTKREGNLC